MRDILTELENWDSNAPVDWNPSSGDILIGVVTGYTSGTSKLESARLSVKEEETGISVTVRLDNPRLANLIKLQRPHLGERIGIKCADSQNYILMVDRLVEQTDQQSSPVEQQFNDIPNEVEDDSFGATQEERSFIEQSLTGSSTPDTTEAQTAQPIGNESVLEQIIQMQKEQITRQSETISKLESLLATAIESLGSKTQSAISVASAPAISYQSLLIWFFGSCIVGVGISWLMHYYQIGWFHK